MIDALVNKFRLDTQILEIPNKLVVCNFKIFLKLKQHDLSNSLKKTFFLFLLNSSVSSSCSRKDYWDTNTESRLCKVHWAVTLSLTLGFASFFLNPSKTVIFMRMKSEDLFGNPMLCHQHPILLTVESNNKKPLLCSNAMVYTAR